MSAVLESVQFETVEGALRFAFRQDRENYQAAIINRMAGTQNGSGRGLGGLEGAAMAGMIGRQVASLGFGPEAILKARYGQRETECRCGRACCKGWTDCEHWNEAVAVVTSYTAAAVTMSKYPLRHGIVRRYFGKRVDMGKLAKKLDIPTRTAEDHTSKVKQFLKQKEGEAFHAISANLREAGIVYTVD